MNKHITIVTGTSGAGKSTLKEYFEQHYGDRFVIYDFDDVGVPEGADLQRRLDTTAYRVERLTEHAAAGEDAILFGQLVPDEIASSTEAMQFISLEADRETIYSRLQQRGRDEEFIQRYQGWTDHIRQSVLRHGGVIVSTSSTIEQSAREILEVIEGEN